MTAIYTWDIFSSLDGFGSHTGDWGGYFGKQGPELLAHRADLTSHQQVMVFGANTYRDFVEMLPPDQPDPEGLDTWVTNMRNLPATVVSSTLKAPLHWPGQATLESGDAVDVIARLKRDSKVPLRSHGSVAMNLALMAAGLVDRLQVTVFPVITGQTGHRSIFKGAADFDLELLEHRTLDGHTQELVYRPTLHG
jgi:dihydrofolate reductase